MIEIIEKFTTLARELKDKDFYVDLKVKKDKLHNYTIEFKADNYYR